MVTIITATGSPIFIRIADDARLENGKLVCLDAEGRRLVTFDPLDVTAFAVETPGLEPQWIMGGPTLLSGLPEPPRTGLAWRLPGRLRFTYR